MGNGEALDCGNYHGLKLTDQVIKLMEQVLDFYICKMVNVCEKQFGFVPGRSTTDTIFIVRQLQEMYITANKLLYFAFIDLEKVFDHVPRKVVWQSLTHWGRDKIDAISQTTFSKFIFLNENARISLKTSLKFVPKV